MYLPDESFNQVGIGCKFDCLYVPHKVPVVMIVAVVIAKHAPIVCRAPPQVDVSKTIGKLLFHL